MRFLTILSIPLLVVATTGCPSRYRQDLDYSYEVEQIWSLEELAFAEIHQFVAVPWDPDQTLLLRNMISEDSIAAGRTVLELGTATGVNMILCLHNGARDVLAIDTSDAAIANARYNAAAIVPQSSYEVRHHDRMRVAPFATLAADQKFDLIIVSSSAEMQIPPLLAGLGAHLAPGGRCLIVCTSRAWMMSVLSQTDSDGLTCELLGDRGAKSLPDDIIPGVIVEVRLSTSSSESGGGAPE